MAQHWKLPIGVLTGLVVGVSPAVSITVARGADSAVIHACVENGDGAVHIVAATVTCKKHETALDWNTQGPTGAEGPAGPAGPAADLHGLLSSPNGTFQITFTDDNGLMITNRDNGKTLRLCPGGCPTP